MSIRDEGRLIAYDTNSAIGVVQTFGGPNRQCAVRGADLTAAGISLTPNADKFLFAVGGLPSGAIELQKITY
jgi:hypothetical protein